MNGAEEKRPYAAAANVLGVLKRCRTRNLPDKIDNDFVSFAGVPDVVRSRVTSALRFLGLTTEDDDPTDILRALAAAPEEQYREILAGAIRSAYETDFARIDPAQDSQKQIIDAFRPYQPRSQTQRMVMLFLALCREAGISVKEAPRERAMGSAAQSGTSTVTDEDVGVLTDDEFASVWAALGQVARARALARSSPSTAAPPNPAGSDSDREEGES